MPNLPRKKTDQGQPATQKQRAQGGSSVLSTIGRSLAILFLLGVIAGCIVVSVLTVYLLQYIDNEETIDLENIKLNYTTILYAQDETTGEYFELQRLHGDENRIWVDYEQMPKYLTDAAIALEDKRFEKHQGVDWKRTIYAAVNMFNPFAASKQGGSTITQQLIKNITGDDEVRVDRKVREIFSAIKLEKRYSKEQVLEAYLNTIALGNNTNGVQAAANLYFDKDVSELSLAECSALVSITQNPWKYDPFQRLDNLKERQAYCLKSMLEQKKITQEEYDTAMAEELVIATATAETKVNTTQNWFVDQVFQDVVDALVEEKGYTETYATQQLLRGGYRVYTTVDVEMQNFLEQKFNVETGTLPGVHNAEYPEGAFVVLGLDGQIKAIAGSNRPKEGALLFNRARDAVRHPGSSIKPIASYAPAVEKDLITYSTLVDDNPITIKDEYGNDKSWPKNFYNTYLGMIPVDVAVRRSTNTIPVKLQQALGVQNTFYFLRDKLGLSTLVEKRVIDGRVYSDINLAPLAIGEMTDGVTPLAMAGAYQIFGNGGLYTKPYSFTKVLDSEGNVILENNPTPVRVISAETATVVNHLMQEVTRGANGTGTTAPFSALPVAGKTGTSDNDHNQWFIGVTPYYVGVCWLGYDIPETINYSGYGYGPPQIWRSIMGPIHDGLPIVQFTDASGVVAQQFCVESGLLASDECPTKQTGWYKKTNLPGPCDLHGPGASHSEDEEYGGDDDEGWEDEDSREEDSSSSRHTRPVEEN